MDQSTYGHLPVLARGCGLVLEGGSEFLHETGESLLVVGRRASVAGVLPIKIQSVESSRTQEIDGVVDKCLHSNGISMR